MFSKEQIEHARRKILHGGEFPYHFIPTAKFSLPAYRAALAVIADLTDRRGIKHGFHDIDEDVKLEIVDTLASIIHVASTTDVIAEKILTFKEIRVLEHFTVRADSQQMIWIKLSPETAVSISFRLTTLGAVRTVATGASVSSIFKPDTEVTYYFPGDRDG